MKNKLIKIIRKIRSTVMRTVKPKRFYYLATKSTKPISRKYGFDRGTPIDRYYIEKFLEENKRFIRGKCLEVRDNEYTKKFGGNVGRSEVIDIDPKVKSATIHADLADMKKVKSDSFDCLLITHTIGVIYDFDKAVKECHRVLKNGGTLLVTSSSFSPAHDLKNEYWRFTPASTRKIFGKYFKKLEVKTFGNVLSGQAFWVGLSQEELTKEELDFNDPNYPCIVTVKAIKSGGKSI